MKKREEVQNVTALLLSVPLRKIVGLDLLVGLLLGGGALYLEVWEDGTYVDGTLPATASLVGVIVGLSLAAIAIQTAFLDLEYLRIADRAGVDPVKTLRTAAWTVVLGVVASLLVIVRSALPAASPAWLTATAGTVTALFVGWAIASVPSTITTLISSIRLRTRSARVPDGEG